MCEVKIEYLRHHLRCFLLTLHFRPPRRQELNWHFGKLCLLIRKIRSEAHAKALTRWKSVRQSRPKLRRLRQRLRSAKVKSKEVLPRAWTNSIHQPSRETGSPGWLFELLIRWRRKDYEGRSWLCDCPATGAV